MVNHTQVSRDIHSQESNQAAMRWKHVHLDRIQWTAGWSYCVQRYQTVGQVLIPRENRDRERISHFVSGSLIYKKM